MKIKDKYINPFTDFGFKKIFGSNFSQDILTDFLNELLKGQEHITILKYLNNEHFGRSEEERKAVFDLYCENQKGEKFIIEVQRGRQRHFKDRSVYYSTFPVQEQAPKKKDWDFNLNKVYLIAMLDFVFEPGIEDEPVKHTIKLVDMDTDKVFYDKLTYIYLEMPRFKKGLGELGTRFDKWLFLLKNLPDFSNRPRELEERIFRKVFDVAEIAKLNKEDMDAYEQSLKYYRDYVNTVDYARMEGIEKGVRKTALSMLENGYSVEEVCKITGLSQSEVEGLLEK